MRVDLSQSLNISVSRLCDVPFFAPALAEAHAREWGHLYAHWNQETALADFSLEKPESDLPTTWVAHHPSGILMGSVSLVLDDLPGHPGLNPWLASLYVFPEFRGRGLGRVLTQKALDFLRQVKCPHAFLFTEDQVPFFSKFHFAVHTKTQAQGKKVTLMKWTNPNLS
jgi:N-acetylglutamate synthase-like GNAT family acetyltransferase